jgi:D-methionine transport system substrate-binding protein
MFLSVSFARVQEVQVEEAKYNTTLVVGTTKVPHAQMLELVAYDMYNKGVYLDIRNFENYNALNDALMQGYLDANFFQHQQHLDDFVEENEFNLVSMGEVHIELMAGYSNTITNIKDLEEGSIIAIPNNPSNRTRALLLLQQEGVITVNQTTDLTPLNIVQNPKNIELVEVYGNELARKIPEVDLAIVNGNTALAMGLNPVKDSVIIERVNPSYANIVVVRGYDTEDEDLQNLVKLLQSEEVRSFIQEEYYGGVIPAF